MSLSSHLNNPTKHRKQDTTSTAGYVSFYCVNPPKKNYNWEVASLGPVSVIYCSLTKSCLSKSVAIERFVIEFRKTRVEVDFS